MSDEARKPVHVVRHGRLSASIWENEGQDGLWYSVSLQRAYKNTKGKWEYSENFNRDDLTAIGVLCNEAYLLVIRKLKANSDAAREKEKGSGGGGNKGSDEKGGSDGDDKGNGSSKSNDKKPKERPPVDDDDIPF